MSRADLGDYDCGACHANRRLSRGCEGGARSPWNEGTRYQNDVCPRRHLLRNPELSQVLQLHRSIGDEPIGLAGLSDLSNAAVQALAIVDDARGEKMREDFARARKGNGS